MCLHRVQSNEFFEPQDVMVVFKVIDMTTRESKMTRKAEWLDEAKPTHVGT